MDYSDSSQLDVPMINTEENEMFENYGGLDTMNLTDVLTGIQPMQQTFNNEEQEEEDINIVTDEYFQPAALPQVKITKSAGYSEYAMLKWAAVAIGGVVLVIAVVSMILRNRRSTPNVVRINENVDDLTQDEKQLLQMQHNGYENPTYKYLEKQIV
uniref:Beta-amyloid precursor protein C-terminal domain-containing protein n=1 Tax=Ciona savignyi TaxID=51511 RepID=H2YPZ5_CIOSA